MVHGNFVVEMEFGSCLYGTSVPTSDVDMKAIYIPPSRDILLQQIKKSVQTNTKTDPNAKNSANDVDMEMFSLDRYMSLLLEGQTVALDMLFAGQKHWKCSSSIWNFVRENKKEFLHKGTSAFAGYTRTQANKYGIKGSRMGAVRTILEYLTAMEQNRRLVVYSDALKQIVAGREHMSIVICLGPNKQPLEHLEVVNRKVPFHATVKYARDLYQGIYDEYGHRARQAETNQGIDWKALMHAVRVCGQANELLMTGNITFPRPNRELLLQIRKGELPYKQVAEIIEQGLSDLEVLEKTSTLQAESNRKFAEDFIESVYRSQVISE